MSEGAALDDLAELTELVRDLSELLAWEAHRGCQAVPAEPRLPRSELPPARAAAPPPMGRPLPPPPPRASPPPPPVRPVEAPISRAPLPAPPKPVAPPPPAAPPTLGAWGNFLKPTTAPAVTPATPAAATAAPVLTGAKGLDAVWAQVDGCTRCGLCAGRSQIVFGVGDPTARVMVIGEGPGEQEDLRGEPFVGPAGQMLDKMLANVLNLPREKAYIANIVKCRPPNNRNPEPAEIAACLPFLRAQMKAIQPRLVLVLGSVASRVFFDKGITQARGRWFTVSWEGGAAPALPTFHPAYLLRKPEDKTLTFADLKVFRQEMDKLGLTTP